MKKRKRIQYKTTIRTGLPPATWRLLNAGIPFEQTLIERLQQLQASVPMVINHHKIIEEAIAEIAKIRKKRK